MHLRVLSAAIVSVVLGTCFGSAVYAAEEDITPPERDWRKGRPPQSSNGQDYADDFFQPPPEHQQNLNDNAPPEPPSPLEDEYTPRGGRDAPPPPPGYENMTLPGEPPRR